MEHPFVKGALDSLGIGVQMDHRHEYKNAMNLFTETEFTAAHREASAAILKSMMNQMVLGISRLRGKTPEDVREIVNRGPFLGTAARAEGLVDSLAYWDEVRESVKDEWGQKAEFLDVGNYRKRTDDPYGEGTTVALIHGIGAIHRGKSDYDPMSASTTMGGEHAHKSISRSGEGRGCARDFVSHRLAGRVLCGVGCDLARGRQGKAGREAGHCLDGQCGWIPGAILWR